VFLFIFKLQGDTSPERIEAFANEVATSLRDSVGETVLPPV
jgi:hypothetical protein